MTERPRRPVRLILTGGDEASGAVWLLGERPLFFGAGALDYVCGACATVLYPGMSRGQLAGLTAVCGCGAVNRVPARDQVAAAA
jgi:hypothetical protein